MAKLVVLSEGSAGRSHELTAERTTIGRVEDNTFQIAEPSISSHHCEVLLKGTEVRVKDLNSTNGTFINDEQITEAVLKPGQILRLGKIELRLENGAEDASGQKPFARTTPLTPGVSMVELEQGKRPTGFEAAGEGFTKKSDEANKLFRIGFIIVMCVLFAVLIYVIYDVSKTK
jgi:pSer/pThr/pTyr-binding forkhead associated (FHA) protein